MAVKLWWIALALTEEEAETKVELQDLPSKYICSY